MHRRDRFTGLLLGTAVGDALGYPAEGLSRTRIKKLYQGRWRHRFLFGRGVVSDDTDQTVLVAQALLRHPHDVERFTRRLASSLRWWLVGLPFGGIGGASLRAILRLWLGVSPSRSGVFSAGNGAAMRAAVIGAYFADDRAKMDAYLRAQTRLTHSDPRALIGARAVATLAAWAVKDDLVKQPSARKFTAVLRSAAQEDEEWSHIASRVLDAANRRLTVEDFARSLGLSEGVSGYVYHTVPVAAYAWHRHFGDFETTLQEILSCGGDTDTVAAIAGALAGSVTGDRGIPEDWIDGLADWPRKVRHLREIAGRACEASIGPKSLSPVPYFWPGMLLRNVFVYVVTLAHYARRLLPPY